MFTASLFLNESHQAKLGNPIEMNHGDEEREKRCFHL